ncbi:MAG: TetR/AcrR family transcriptional regulator [Actinomycetota bacterium]|nr:TetR/AcrR family transcriptional regulator [Actinomycetota bacterium]
MGGRNGSGARDKIFILSDDNITTVRRTRDDIRQRLLESALVEFGAKGFDGASTRSIAQRVDAHQPQINYHFASKEALWVAAVDHLFGQLGRALASLDLRVDTDELDRGELAPVFAEAIRRFVRFAAAHPELNQIMVHAATEDSDRLRWMVERHVRPLYDVTQAVWQHLRDAGVAAPIDPSMVHYVIVGAASLPFVNAPEARLLLGVEPTDPAWVDTHANGLVATLLPGLTTAVGVGGASCPMYMDVTLPLAE